MSFEQQIKKIIVDREKETTNIFRAISFQLFDRIIRRTPVDTGRARANWNADIDSADLSTTDEQDKSGGSTSAKMQDKTLKAQLGNTLYLTNNLDYIGELEYGHSLDQAPDGMVRVTAAEFRQVLEGQKNGH